MGAVRILLPVPRTLARAHVGLGGPLLGAALLRCLTPGLFLIWWRPPQRLLAWSEEAVAVYRTLHEGPRRRGGDGLALALVLYANALFLAGRYEEALAASDESRTVVGARMSPTQSAYALRVRTLLLTETGRLGEVPTAARQCVAAYRKSAPRGRERSLGSYADALRVTIDADLAVGRFDDAVAALRRLLALDGRTDLPAVHAACLGAFADAHDVAAHEIRGAWQAATTEPFPSIDDPGGGMTP
ncbi:hypothetical protein AB0J81_26320 [Streptomyces bobili]|uniref:hypothetical protein n=1 Tax=Streptomyces bobili TaxID=67280 RepID=UPI00341CE194